jgi:phage/plasmid-like protein (TIGR03299 family)
MSLLDTILAAQSGPVILSEQHDIRKIDWQAGARDAGEMVRGGIEGGISRAALDVSTGRVAVMVAGQAPWHKLGVNVESAVDSADAMRLAALDWRVDKVAMQYVDSLGTAREQSEVYAMIRRDTGAMLGSVGSRYTPIQNSAGFKFLDSVLGSFGAKYESAGACYGGKRVWMLVRLPAQSFAVNQTDEINAYALFTNPHDGSGVAECFPTSERVVCANTLRVARDKDTAKGIRIRHTGDVQTKIDSAKRALGLAVESFDTFKQSAERLSTIRVPSIENYANDVLDCVLELTAADCAKGPELLASVLDVSTAERQLAAKCFSRKIERRGEILTDILERYDSEKNGIAGMRGTAWGAFNAVTEFADHSGIASHRKGSADTRASRRFESVISGQDDDLKQAAFSTALALAN